MIILPLSRRHQRVAALLILLLALALGLIAVVLPAIAFVDNAEVEFRLAQKRLGKLELLIQKQPRLEGDLAALRSDAAWGRVYRDLLEAQANAAVQSDFRAMAASQSLTLESVQPLETDRRKGPVKIGVRVAFSAYVDQLIALMVAAEGASKPLRFDNLYVTVPGAADGRSNPLLVVRADVVGYWLKPDQP